jgi:hypothetical protein
MRRGPLTSCRECLDHIVIFGETPFAPRAAVVHGYYNEARTHLSLNKDAPAPHAVERAGHILCQPVAGGLRHQYGRI